MCSGSISLNLSLTSPKLFCMVLTTGLTFTFLTDFLSGESQSLSLAKVFEQITSCSKLVKLEIMLLGQESDGNGIVAPIQDVWDNTTFTFPSLKVCSLVFKAIMGQQIEFECFLQRHPSIERLRYSSTHKFGADLRPDLPNLSAFDGSEIDFLTLSRDVHSCSIDLLMLKVDTLNDGPDGELLLVNALKGVSRTLHKLVLHYHSRQSGLARFFAGMGLRDIGAITAAYPNLTHLECELDRRATGKFLVCPF